MGEGVLVTIGGRSGFLGTEEVYRKIVCDLRDSSPGGGEGDV